MADSSVTGLSFFNKTDISIEPAVQQFCQCCQNENIWDCGDSAQNSPAMLACGHSLCFNCVKTQWLDTDPQDSTVFCLTCSKRVPIFFVKSTDKEICGDKVMSQEPSPSAKDSDDGHGVWALEQKDEMPLQEWVNPNICENFVLKLITTSHDSCLSGNTLVLDNNAGMVEYSGVSHGDDSSSPVKQEVESTSEKSPRYNVSRTDSKTVANDTSFADTADGMTVQSGMLGSPDLNLKALLQILDKNSLPSLGASAEGSETNPYVESFSGLDTGGKEEIHCFNGSRNVCENSEIEVDGLAEKPLCEEAEANDDWRPVGIVQNGSYIFSREKVPVVHTVPCAVYIPNSETITTDDYVCMSGIRHQRSSLHEMEKVNDKSNSHPWFSPPDRGFSNRSNPRPRRGRKRKPILKHFQSEFFMRPYMKRENIPQLQLVKLVRQRTRDKEDEEEEKAEEATLTSEENFQHEMDVKKRNPDDPELAFMKTVDMPSGKRVEDIYVVPSVWISNDKKPAGKLNCNRESTNLAEGDVCSCFPMEGNQRVPIQVYSHGNQAHFLNACQTPYWRQVHGSFSGYQPGPHSSFPNPARRGLHSSSSDMHMFKPAQNLYRVVRGHIITTLNAPKLELVPSLKDLCKTALGLDPAAATMSHLRESSKIACGSESHMLTNSAALEQGRTAREISTEIKTPKEFLHMLGAGGETEMPEMEDDTGNVDSEIGKDIGILNMLQKGSTVINFTASSSVKKAGKFDLNGKVEKLSDSEETLPENPLFTEDVKKIDGTTTLIKDSSPCECLQAKTNDCKKIDNQFQDHLGSYTASRPARISQMHEAFKCHPPTVSSHSSMKPTCTDYIIPVVGYKLKDSIKDNYNQPKPDCQNSDCIFSKNNSGQKKFGRRSFSTPSYSSSSVPMILDETYPDDTYESNLMSLPSLISVAKQIRNLSSIEPLNKPLANLTSALNLLCNAEKTLCNTNFIIYRQVKSDTKSKLGRLNLCICKLGDSVVAMGGTLQEWMKETTSRCFKTMGVLTDLYNSNIVALIELITPYFHYVCELIASCHSEIVPWSKDEPFNQSSCLTDHQPMKTDNSWLSSNMDSTLSCRSKALSTFSYAESQKSASPKDYKRQDYDHLMSSEEFGEGDSEASLSGQTSTKISPKAKSLPHTKRGRPLGSKNGQRRVKVSHLKSKPMKLKLSPAGIGVGQGTCSESKFCGISSGQPSLLLPNTVLVSMSSDILWSEANAGVLQKPQNVVSKTAAGSATPSDLAAFGKTEQHVVQIPTTATTWMLPPGMRGTCHSIPVHLNISDENGEATLSLLDSELNEAEDDPDIISVDDSKSTSAECSPSKKSKLENTDVPMDSNAYSNIVVTLPENVNIVVSNSSRQNEAGTDANTTSTEPLQDSTTSASGLGVDSSNLQRFQSVFFIQDSQDLADCFHLNTQQLSAALLGTKGKKDMQERFEIALMQSDDSIAFSEDVKVKVPESQSVSNLDLDADTVNETMFGCNVGASDGTENL